MKDEATAIFLEERTKKKEEWYSAKFNEIKAFREQILYSTKNKNFDIKEEMVNLPQKQVLTRFLTLKKTMMKFEKNKPSSAMEFNEKEFETKSHSFIFKNVKLLEEKNRFSLSNFYNAIKKLYNLGK